MFRTGLFASCVFAGCVSAVLGTAPAGAQVTIDWVTVGNAGNAADSFSGFGSVAYPYRIGATEVTNEQYAAFLNAVAASDPNGLYNPSMGGDPRAGITRSGSNGFYTYSVRANMGNKPVNFVSWYNAVRFCNWMTNGQPTGPQNASTTESGVYTLDGPVSIVAITRDLSNPNHVFLPTEDEWYKAAYHQPASQGGDGDDYWLYATQSNSVPTIGTATSTGDIANPGSSVVNYFNGADWNGQDGNVTTVGSAGNTSFYGAFDMNGNVYEWNETLIGALRGFRGGAFVEVSEVVLQSSFQFFWAPEISFGSSGGFRVASSFVTPSCPADTNGDGLVTPGDFNAWILAFNAQAPECDQNGDGLCAPADFNAWVLNYNAGCP